MTTPFDRILAGLPEKPPRSRLEPYRVLIEELRARKRTFQEIAGILTQQCGVRVSASGVHDYLRRRGGKAEATRPDAQHRATPTERAPVALREDYGEFEFDPTQPLKIGGRSK